ncbi:MAG: hypothetical protein NC307_14530 [Roseburia sp.]|nr:hypothetical protein [Roseburia sp.]
MKQKISAEVLRNRQINYLIIEKMWAYFNKGTDKQSFYDLLDIPKNMYSRIRSANTYNTADLDARWERKNSPLHKLGLSKEIMTGMEPIQVEGITMDDWDEYLQFRYKSAKTETYRSSSMQGFNKRLKDAFSKLKADKKDQRDIGKLFYFFQYGRASYLDLPDAEMVDLRDSLRHISIENMKVCDRNLRREIFVMLEEKYRQLDIILKYEGLNG